MQQTMANTSSQHLPAINDAMLKSLGLAESDLPAIHELANRIQISSVSSVADFGRDAAAHSSDLADELLTQVRSGDLDTAGEKLTEVVSIARSLNVGPLSDRRSKLPLIGPYIDKMRLRAFKVAGRLDTAKNQIDVLLSEVETTQHGLATRNSTLETMFDIVKQEHHQLGLHIAAGRLRLHEMSALVAELKNSAGDDPTKVQELADLSDMVAKLDKRVGDLGALRHAALQSLPMIRMVQSNNQMLVDKFHSIKAVTVPAWKRQLSMQLALNEQQNAVALTNSIDNATNQLLLENAKLLHDNSVQTAKSNQRLVIDVDTLASVQATLIGTVEEVIKIREQGVEARRKAESQLEALRTGLLQNLAGKKALGQPR